MSVMLFARRIKTLAPAEAWNARRQKSLVLWRDAGLPTSTPAREDEAA
jgi:hypothetical protein